MANSSAIIVRALIDAETRIAVAKALQEMKLAISDRIRMVLVRVTHEKAVLFTAYAPIKEAVQHPLSRAK